MAEDSAADVDEEDDSLELFINDTDKWIGDILHSLGWSKEHVLQTEERIVCPNNRGHIVLRKNLDDHLSYCRLLCRGYSKKEISVDQSSKFCYEKAPAVVSVDLDEPTLKSILTNSGGLVPSELPATLDHARVAFNSNQKLQIYEHCVGVARTANASTHIADEDLTLLEDKKTDRPLTKLEMLAKMRDMKRRRQSYRGKNTHTSKKNHTEVIRDVLSNQMELLASIWADEMREKEEKKRQEDEAKRTLERQGKSANRHRSRSRSHSRRSRSRSEADHHRHHHRSKHRHRAGSDDSSDGGSSHRYHGDKADDNRWRDDIAVNKSSSRHKKRSHSRSRSKSRRKRSRQHGANNSFEEHASADIGITSESSLPSASCTATGDIMDNMPLSANIKTE